MLPVYLTYFAGQDVSDTGKKNRAVINALGFVAGFTLLFVILGAFAGHLGLLLRQYRTAINLVSGGIMVLFGLNFMGVIRLPFINNVHQAGKVKPLSGFFPAMLFGIVFSISWTPCVGTFLGSALMLAAQGGGGSLQGILMLFLFSMGLGIPFILSAVLIDKLKSTFDFIKRNYRVINLISGGLLVVLGILVATGLMNRIYLLISP